MTGPLLLALELGCAPPSNGAHMLAWWLASRADLERRFTSAFGLGAGRLELLLSGEWEPGEERRHSIAGFTAGAVPADEWERGCGLDWADRPLGWAGPPGRFAAAAPRTEA